MIAYITRRLLLIIPTLIGMTLILFSVVRFAPGVGVVGGLEDGGRSTKQDREAQELAVKQRLRIVDDKGNPIPLPMQYIYWLGDTARGNLGSSVKYSTPVSELLKERLPVTISLNLISAVIVYFVAIPGGMLAAVKRGRSFDVTWSLASLALYSLPVIWVGSMMIGFLCNPQFPRLNLFPSAGLHSANAEGMTYFQYARDYIWHITLPVIAMSYAGFAYLSKVMRASMLDNLHQDFARTARAKGLSNTVVVTRHVFRNSLLPMITIFAGVLPGMMAGSVIIEKIFSIKGMGDLMLTAALSRDLPLLQAVSLIASVVALISLLITDICYAIADPRVSYD